MDQPLVTDRPDFTESTESVPAGHAQIEAGYTFTFDRENEDRVRDHTAGELLLRIGVVDNFELRIGWDGYSWTDNRFQGETRGGRRVTRDDTSEGAHDLTLGFKWKLLEQSDILPDFGLLAAISVPSGSTGLSSGDVEPAVVLLWAHDLTDAFAIAGNVSMSLPFHEAGQFFQTSASLSAAFTLTEKTGVFVEYFGFYPNAPGSDAAHYVNGGLTYLVTRNVQLDGRVGVGLNEEADDFFTGVGISYRF